MIMTLNNNEFLKDGLEELTIVFGGSYDALSKDELVCTFERDQMVLRLNTEKWELSTLVRDKKNFKEHYKIENCFSLQSHTYNNYLLNRPVRHKDFIFLVGKSWLHIIDLKSDAGWTRLLNHGINIY